MGEDVGGVAPVQILGGFDAGARLWVVGLFGLGGAGLGVVLPHLANWATELPWVPFSGPLELLASLGQSWPVWGLPTVGFIAGLVFAGWVVLSTPVLHLSRSEVRFERRGQLERVIPHGKVDSVYRRGSKIIIETERGRELFNDEIEGDKATIRDAFIAYGYPWEGEGE